MRLRRGARDRRPVEVAPAPQEGACALCGRPIPAGARASRHHLTPKLEGGAGRPTVLLHQICHSAIHARFTEAELARRLAEIESLRTAPELARFLHWVRTKPPGFHRATRRTKGRQGRGRA